VEDLVEEVHVSFASEPGRDDSNLPPVNIVVPDDARELARDVLAYHREMRARRRRQRLTRLFSPFGRQEFGGHTAILPLIATIVALAMLAGAMLSVITISPASAPTVPPTLQTSAVPGFQSRPISLPAGTVRVGAPPGRIVQPRSLVNSVLVLVPANCQCGTALRSLAAGAILDHLGLYFVASGAAIPQLAELTVQYGGGAAQAVYDTRDVIGGATHAVGLTVLLVRGDGTAYVGRDLPRDYHLSLEPRPAPAAGK
jgi:hypothetical protein